MPRKPANNDPPPAGLRFLYWIAEAAMAAREQAGASRERVADLIGVGAATVKRFENAENWPHDPDRFMASYAQAAGLDDPREIYQRALDLWYEHGSRPLLSAKDDGGGATGAERLAEELTSGRSRPREPAGRGRSSTAAPRRRAGG